MPWLKVNPFADHAGVSPRLVRDWLKTGLPYSRLPSGTILIEVEQADEWLRSFAVKKDGGNIVDKLLDELLKPEENIVESSEAHSGEGQQDNISNQTSGSLRRRSNLSETSAG